MIPVFFVFPGSNYNEEVITELEAERFNSRLSEVQNMIMKDPKYNQQIAFFIDMKIKSGKNVFSFMILRKVQF